MSLLRTFAVIALALFSNQVYSAENSNSVSRHYFEFDYARNTLKTKDTLVAGIVTASLVEAEMDGGIIKYGYDINNWFAVEGHLGSTTSQDDAAISYSAKIQYMGFAGARFNLRYDHFTLYGLAGAGYASVKETSAGTEFSTKKGGAAYGIGMDFYGSKTTSISLSYIQYVDSTEVDLSSLQLGVKFYFDKPQFKNRY